MRPLSLHQLVAPDVGPAELTMIAATLGCQHVCLFTQAAPGLAVPVVTEAEMAGVGAAMRDTGVTALGAAAFALSPDLSVDDYAPALDRAARLGASRVSARVVDADEPRATDNFGRFAALAAQHGIVAGIEFTGFGNRDALPQALRIIAAAGQGKITVDALHLVRTGTSIEALRQLAPGMIAYVQLCDGPLDAGAEDYAQEGPLDRLAPGDGEFPLLELLDLLPPDQPLSLEVPCERLRLRGISAADRARHVIEGARRLLASAS